MQIFYNFFANIIKTYHFLIRLKCVLTMFYYQYNYHYLPFKFFLNIKNFIRHVINNSLFIRKKKKKFIRRIFGTKKLKKGRRKFYKVFYREIFSFYKLKVKEH